MKTRWSSHVRVSWLPAQLEMFTLSAPLNRNLSRLSEYREANLRSRQLPMYLCHLMLEDSPAGYSGSPGQSRLSFQTSSFSEVLARTVSEVSLKSSSLGCEAFSPELQKTMRCPLAPSSRLHSVRFRCRIARSAFSQHALDMRSGVHSQRVCAAAGPDGHPPTDSLSL